MSNTLKISRRYAVALVELIQEDEKLLGALKQVRDISLLSDMQVLLDSPAYSYDEKLSVFKKALKGEGSDEMLRLVQLLLHRGKISLLNEIVLEVEELLVALGKSVEVEVISAVPMKAAAMASLKKTISAAVGKDVTLNMHEDASMIGGFVVRLGDRKIDYSVKSKLEGMRQAIAG